MVSVGTGARQHGGQGLVREFCATRFEVAFERLDDDHSLHFNLTHLLSNMDSLEESSSKLTPSLCLAPPIVESPDEKSDAFSEELFRWLDKLEDVLRRVVGSEARVWLCSAVAELVVPHRVQASVFMSFLREAALTHSFQAKRQGAEYSLTFSCKFCYNLRMRGFFVVTSLFLYNLELCVCIGFVLIARESSEFVPEFHICAHWTVAVQY